MKNKAQRQYDDDRRPPAKPKILLVQFYSELLTRDENADAKAYYDKLYSTLPGYNRFGPTWEIPLWIVEMRRNFPNADITFAKSVADVQCKQGNYTHLAFSALDCNWHLIREIADGFNGTVIVGGYCDIDNLQDLQNVCWCHSIRECCEIFGVEYKTGVDYSDFVGAKTIARLTLSTGCRHRCKFCTVPNDVVKTPANDVYQQADEICRLNSPLVYINDKTFGQCDNFWMLPTLRQYMLKSVMAGCITFDGFIIQTTPSQLLKLDDDFLLAAGIRYVELGVETCNDAILTDMRKPATEKTIDAATEKLRRLGIKLIPNIMIGLPGETQTTYSRTLHWLTTNADVISHVNIYNLAVYADSELADDLGFADNHTDENRLPAGRAELLFACLLYRFGNKCLGQVCDKCNTVGPTLRITDRDTGNSIEACDDCTRAMLGARVMLDTAAICTFCRK